MYSRVYINTAAVSTMMPARLVLAYIQLTHTYVHTHTVLIKVNYPATRAKTLNDFITQLRPLCCRRRCCCCCYLQTGRQQICAVVILFRPVSDNATHTHLPVVVFLSFSRCSFWPEWADSLSFLVALGGKRNRPHLLCCVQLSRRDLLNEFASGLSFPVL